MLFMSTIHSSSYNSFGGSRVRYIGILNGMIVSSKERLVPLMPRKQEHGKCYFDLDVHVLDKIIEATSFLRSQT